MGTLDRRTLIKILSALIPASYLPVSAAREIKDDWDDEYDEYDECREEYPPEGDENYQPDPFGIPGEVHLFHTTIDAILDHKDITNCACILVGEHPRTMEGMFLREFTKLSMPVGTPLRREGGSFYTDDICWPQRNPKKAGVIKPVAGMLMYNRGDRKHPAVCYVSCGRFGEWPSMDFSDITVNWHREGVFTVSWP